MTEEDIIAAREKAASNEVPWNRREAVRQALAVAHEKARKRRRVRAALIAWAIAMTAAALWMYWRTR
jgi:hypothetical protein